MSSLCHLKTGAICCCGTINQWPSFLHWCRICIRCYPQITSVYLTSQRKGYIVYHSMPSAWREASNVTRRHNTMNASSSSCRCSHSYSENWSPGFNHWIVTDSALLGYDIKIETGNHKNINKNPVAEKAVQELEREILQCDPSGDPISATTLASAVSRLNTRIRNRGLSAYEMWFRREQHTNTYLTSPVDTDLIKAQHELRLKSHSIDKNKHGGKPPSPPALKSGDLVYLRTKGNKSQARRRYIVVSTEPPFCFVWKFTDTQFRKRTY